jgi:DNA-binding response OmpR family regulator
MQTPEQPFHVCIVDDEASARLTAIAALDTTEFSVREFHNAQELLDALNDFASEAPDLILLDIEMPGMIGIEACRRLRATGNDTVQVMFVSSHNDLETRLTAYDAGGNDYIVKPFELAELTRKVDVARQCAARRRDLGTQMQFAQQTAFTAMSSMSEMGIVLEFLRNSFACDTPAALAARLFDALRQYGLDGLAKLRVSGEWQYFSSKGECTPLECSILEHAGTMDRIFQFRDRLTINYPSITLVFHPLPLDDPERVGRLRDHLAVLAEGADTHLQALEIAQRQRVQASGIGEVIIELSKTLEEVDRLQAEHRLRAAEIDEAYLEDLITTFIHLGLSDHQERTLADMAQHTHQKLAALRDENSSVGDRLRDAARKLNRLVGN